MRAEPTGHFSFQSPQPLSSRADHSQLRWGWVLFSLVHWNDAWLLETDNEIIFKKLFWLSDELSSVIKELVANSSSHGIPLKNSASLLRPKGPKICFFSSIPAVRNDSVPNAASKPKVSAPIGEGNLPAHCHSEGAGQKKWVVPICLAHPYGSGSRKRASESQLEDNAPEKKPWIEAAARSILR